MTPTTEMPAAEPMVSPWTFVHASNAVSYLALASAGASVWAAAQHQLHWMAAGWAVAAIADNFDGAFARRFERTALQAEFGAELDSLCDAVCFGFAPIAGLAVVAPIEGPVATALFAVAALAYLVALLTRLGHFNLAHRRGHTGFNGVPSTEAALGLATVLLVPGILGWAWAPLLLAAWLMLAPIPIRRPRGVALAALVAWLFSVPVTHAVLAVLGR